jgi:2-polyprenyl-3-methyl-5-hydroxy-6-metoxy-1,4-benzoquinol methylase
VELRLSQIVAPKLQWVIDQYRKHCGRDPRTVLDVGAGAGHFVEGCRRKGLNAEGYEISKASCRFAREVFGIELRNEDFLSELSTAKVDVITFWGLLEYVPQPRQFLQAARRRLNSSEGMLVVEIPRCDCLSTAIQKEFPKTVARHMDPTSHVNCFSDASAAMALLKSGFEPKAAWYFGMDAYEVLMQLAMNAQDDQLIDRFAQLIPGLQAALDRALLCDDLIIAAIASHQAN